MQLQQVFMNLMVNAIEAMHSRSIVESHGGRLWATTRAPRGPMFWFNLPAKGDS